MSNTTTEKKLIKELTPEQQALVPVYLEKYEKIGLSTEPCDRPRAEAALTRANAYLKKRDPSVYGDINTMPIFIWADSPFAGARLAAKLAKPEAKYSKSLQDFENLEVSEDDIRNQASKASYGSLESYWVAFYDFISENLPVDKDEFIDIVKEITLNCGVYWIFKDIIIVTEKPVAIHVKRDAEGQAKLHNPDGLALEYRDGEGIFMYEGVRYPSLLEMEIAKAAENKAS